MKRIENGNGQLGTHSQSNFDRCVASCKKLWAQMQEVKEQIVAEFRGRLDGHQHMLDLAVNEAEAVAWQSGFPQLFFPVLATEKARAITNWHLRQQSLRSSPRTLAA